MKKHRLAITMGDPAGIGAEILVKALCDPKAYDSCAPVVIGDEAPIADAIRLTGAELRVRSIESPLEASGERGVIDLIDMGCIGVGGWAYGKVSERCGEASYRYIERGVDMAMRREVDGVVTCPICKEAVNLAGHRYSGHTEIFAALTGAKACGMMLVAGALRVIHVTTHVSMREACDIIRDDPERVRTVIALADEAARLMGVDAPRVAVAGLNAHCSENGLFGDEERLSIAPAILAARDAGIDAEGPLPPDTVFVKAIAGQYDVVVAMYHDQGHIPLKLCGFKLDAATGRFTSMSGVNITVGLPIIRTSVDHGTAFDRAGEGRANEESLLEALRAAVVMADRRFPLGA